jgi:hypothetical protein
MYASTLLKQHLRYQQHIALEHTHVLRNNVAIACYIAQL